MEQTPAISSLDPYLNIPFNDINEKTNLGLHFEETHNTIEENTALVILCATKAQTPKPVYARVIPIIPPVIKPMNDTLAVVLKSILIAN